MHLKRMTALMALMMYVLDEKFQMRYWTCVSGREDGTANLYPPTRCDTAACVGGHAASYPPFMEEGLTLDAKGSWLAPMFDGCRDFAALAKFFEISYLETEFIFGREWHHAGFCHGQNHDSVTDAVDRIQYVIEANTD